MRIEFNTFGNQLQIQASAHGDYRPHQGGIFIEYQHAPCCASEQRAGDINVSPCFLSEGFEIRTLIDAVVFGNQDA